MRHALTLGFSLLACACGDSMLTGDGNADARAAGFIDASDTQGSSPPSMVDVCAEAECWRTDMAISICGTNLHTEDFSSGTYNAHRYQAVLWNDTPVHFELTRESGAWEPLLVINDLDGKTLYDGTLGLQEEGISVTASSTGVSVDVLSSKSMGIEVVVTSHATFASEFLDGIDTEASYSLAVTGDCGVPAQSCVVNGHQVAEPACGWLHFIARRVVPTLEGSRAEKLDAAARVAWWSLKEGVLFLDNPLVYSNCSVEGTGDVHIGAMDLCQPGRAWQVGLAGMQAAYLDTSTVEQSATALYPTEMLSEILERSGQEAGLNSVGVSQVMAATTDLRRSWLLRESSIGFHHQVPVVTRECIDGTRSWCFGSGWPSTAKFAPNREAALRSIADIRGLFEVLAP